jgi:CBS-domain-containing membrane protein
LSKILRDAIANHIEVLDRKLDSNTNEAEVEAIREAMRKVANSKVKAVLAKQITALQGRRSKVEKKAELQDIRKHLMLVLEKMDRLPVYAAGRRRRKASGRE